MSRSYREPWYTQSYGTSWRRWAKRYANKAVRRAMEVPDGKAYRKFFDSWDICDYRSLYNPRPRYRNWGGKIVVIEPEPLYRVNRK